MKKIDIAYLAGVIDSDGTIGIKKSTYSCRVVGDSTQATFSERICVKQVEPFAVALLHSTFGGSHYITKPSTKQGRQLYTWQVTDVKAINVIKAIRPFLRIKHRQADTCFELRKIKAKSKKLRMARGRGHVGASRRPVEITKQMESLKTEISILNKTGT